MENDFLEGPDILKDTLNEIQRMLREVALISGDDFLQVNRNPQGTLITLDVEALQSSIPRFMEDVGVQWFNLTNVTTNPMIGTMQIFDPNAGPPAWVDHNLIDVDVYRHPYNVTGNLLANFYVEGLCACVWIGGRWWAVNSNNSGAGVHKAFLNEDAPAATSISCKLDLGITGIDISVLCEISGGGNLDEAVPRLKSDGKIFVSKLGQQWHCLTVFQGAKTCACM